jgi:hypothetical protein
LDADGLLKAKTLEESHPVSAAPDNMSVVKHLVCRCQGFLYLPFPLPVITCTWTSRKYNRVLRVTVDRLDGM